MYVSFRKCEAMERTGNNDMLMLSKISDLIYYFVTITFLVSLAQASVALEGRVDMKIRCSAEINEFEWTKIKATKVHVKIENLAKEVKSFMAIPSFVLEEGGSETRKEEYWSPINLQDVSVRIKESKTDSLTLQERESRTLDIDVSKLNWAFNLLGHFRIFLALCHQGIINSILN